ncbi:MAG TPA: magnesium transporter [Actinomycetota bacterium]|nr:magnesium transporter [Actinomycetota bacterium]
MPVSSSAGDLVEALGTDFIQRHPTDAAHLLEEIDAGEAADFLAAQPGAVGAGLIERTNPDRAVELLLHMAPEAVGRVAGELDLQLLAGLLARMEPEEQAAQFEALGSGVASELKDLMSYPEGSAGSLMDPRVTVFREDETADEVLATLRRPGREVDGDVQVVDAEGKLLGRLSIRSLISADPEAAVGTLASPPIAVPSTANLDEVLDVGLGSRSGISVIDVDGRLLGLIRRNRLTSAAEEEATTDLQAMVGVGREERALSRPMFSVRKRLPWLFINLVTAFLAAAVVGIFEGTIAQVTALAVLLPIVAGQSGNSGSQALAVTMRGLALREVRISQWRRLGSKELMVGVVNGAAIALVTGLGVVVWSGSFGLGLVIAVAMVISMAMAGLAGAGIPLALKAFGQDPAQSSSIFLTTVTDIVGFISFLGLATLFADRL